MTKEEIDKYIQQLDRLNQCTTTTIQSPVGGQKSIMAGGTSRVLDIAVNLMSGTPLEKLLTIRDEAIVDVLKLADKIDKMEQKLFGIDSDSENDQDSGELAKRNDSPIIT